MSPVEVESFTTHFRRVFTIRRPFDHFWDSWKEQHVIVDFVKITGQQPMLDSVVGDNTVSGIRTSCQNRALSGVVAIFLSGLFAQVHNIKIREQHIL
jgi:hypothetical protein